MLSAKYRFHGHGSLRFVYSKGQVVRSRHFLCKYTKNARRTEPRVAVVVSKKVIKSAVKRNQIRRRLYEAVRQELPGLTAQADIVFIVVSAELLTLPHIELTAAVQSLFKQAGLYKTTKI